ncbi:MAG: DUF4465 domain-containing protein [Prevotellaceae bacterium]|nr:DUF4465 domain-containing protein [Prevotellaceae bacterium]
MTKKLFLATLAIASLTTLSCTKDNDDSNNSSNNTDNSGQDTTATGVVYDTLVVDFSDLKLEPNSHWEGKDAAGQFVSGKATFLNSYNSSSYPFDSWSGFAYSKQNDTTTDGFTSQFDVYTATSSNRGIFAVGYRDTYATDTYTPVTPTITFSEPVALQSADFALNVYAYKIMRDGDPNGFAKKFTANDWYKITVKNIDSVGLAVDSLDVYLADFREGKSMIVDSWTKLNLAPLGTASKLTFEVSSSDVGELGMNTPAYFCLDSLVFCVPK